MSDGASDKKEEEARFINPLYRLARHKMLLVLLGGAIGSLARYELGRWVSTQTWAQGGFPYGTFIINVTGSFILGMAGIFLLERFPHFSEWYILVGVGFCGGYTTFSSFEWETLGLVRNGSWRLALTYVVGSVTAGFIGVWLGAMLVRVVFPVK